MLDILLICILILFAVAGMVLAVLQLPGSWLILAAAVGYDWYHGWQPIGWKWLLALTLLAAAGEVAELFAAAVVAKRAGASRRAAIGALVGGLLGMIFLSLPLPIVGTIAGGFFGCFLGALAGELTLHNNLERGARVGILATIGRLLGMMIKTAVAMTLAGVTVSLAIANKW